MKIIMVYLLPLQSSNCMLDLSALLLFFLSTLNTAFGRWIIVPSFRQQAVQSSIDTPNRLSPMIAEAKPYVPCLTFASQRRRNSYSSFSKFQFHFPPSCEDTAFL